MALSTTPGSTSANAWPARPFHALPRPIRGSIGLRAFRNVPSGAGVRADRLMRYPATKRAAVQLIETDSISVIGPNLPFSFPNTCTFLNSDPNNCGVCGNICGGATPYCAMGLCTDCGGFGAAFCDGVCINILSDNGNCGACGVQCAADEICTFGVCSGMCDGCGWY